MAPASPPAHCTPVRGAEALQLDRLLDQHHRNAVVDDVEDLPILSKEPFSDRRLDRGAAAVPQAPRRNAARNS